MTDRDHNFAEWFLIETVQKEWRGPAQINISDRDYCLCERAAGVNSPNPRLREGIREAVFLCAVMNAGFPLRLRSRDLERQAMRSLETHAAEALNNLTYLHAAIDQLKSFAPGYITEHVEKRGAAEVIAELPHLYPHLQNILVVCQKYSKAQKPGRGHPERWRSFEELVKVLAKSFETVTGEKATANPDKYKPPEEKYHRPFVMFVACRGRASSRPRSYARRLAAQGTSKQLQPWAESRENPSRDEAALQMNHSKKVSFEGFRALAPREYFQIRLSRLKRHADARDAPSSLPRTQV